VQALDRDFDRATLVSIATRLALIAVGYALSIAGGFAAVTVNEAFMPAEIAQTSGGMVAFGDMILFVLVGGLLSLAPTWFLLKLANEQAPRTLVATLLLIAAIGPVSWLATLNLASKRSRCHELASCRSCIARPVHRVWCHPAYCLWPDLPGD
jgi:hypothetical protein